MLGRFQTAMVIAALAVAGGCSKGSDRGQGGASTSAPPKQAAASAAVIEQGGALYKKHCTACHGEGGKGDGPAAGVMKPPPRDHTDRAYMSTLSDKEIADIIRMGGAIKGKPLMPSNPQINGDDLLALVGYVRTLSQPAR